MGIKRVGILALSVSVCLGARQVVAPNPRGPAPLPPRANTCSANEANDQNTRANTNPLTTHIATNDSRRGSSTEVNTSTAAPTTRDQMSTARSVPNNPFEGADFFEDADAVEESAFTIPVHVKSVTPRERIPLVLKIEEVDASTVVKTTIGNVTCFKVASDENVFTNVEIGDAKRPINCQGPESVVCFVSDANKHYIMVANKIEDSWRRCNLSVEKGGTFIRRDFASGTKFPVEIDFESIFNKPIEEVIEPTPVDKDVGPEDSASQNESEASEDEADEDNVQETVDTLQESIASAEGPVVVATPTAVAVKPPVANTVPGSRNVETNVHVQATPEEEGKVAVKPPSDPVVKEEVVTLADGKIEAPLNSTLVNSRTIADTEPEIIYTYKHNDGGFLFHYRIKRLPNRHLYHKVSYGSQVPDLLKSLNHLGQPYDSEVDILFWDSLHSNALLAQHSVQIYEDFSVLDLDAGEQDVLFVMANVELWLPKQQSHQLILYKGATRSWMSLESSHKGGSRRYLLTPDPHYPGGCTLTLAQ